MSYPAQRLSASQGATHSRHPVLGGNLVLNAFRHHRVLRAASWADFSSVSGCSTPFGITGCYALVTRPPFSVISSAQRLSASQGATLSGGAWYGRRPCRAQRLSASQGATRRGEASRGPRQDVLNAFRHHRVLRVEGTSGPQLGQTCSTPFGITGCYATTCSAKMSTLSCAQRLSASQGATHNSVVMVCLQWVCSTPFGITGCYADPREGDSGGPDYVLNAFRHHRVLRPERERDYEQGLECSTPFGITGCYAKPSAIASNSAATCSTPFGITGCYAGGARYLQPFHPGCSTPFGITGCYAEKPK